MSTVLLYFILENMRLFLSMFWRDLRSGIFSTLLLALVIATASLSSVGFLSERVLLGLEKEKSALLGADLVLRSHQPIRSEWQTLANTYPSLRRAETVVLPSMVYGQNAPDTEQLVSVKAVSEWYPLNGCLKRQALSGPIADCQGAPRSGTVWVDPMLLEKLSLHLGDHIQIGEQSFEIDALILEEPDSGSVFSSIAPRVMISLADLAATELIGVGSRAQYRWLLSGNTADLAQIRTTITPQLVDQYQLFESVEEGRPELQNTLERGQMFLSLVALLSTLIASVALSLSAVRYAQSARTHIAIMRCLGWTAQMVLRQIVFSFMALGVLGGSIGALIGWGAHYFLLYTLEHLFLIALPAPTIYPALQSLLVGVLLILGCVLVQLLPLYKTAPSQVLRRTYAVAKSTYVMVALPFLGVFFALLWMYTENLWLTVRIGGGMLLVLLFFIGVSIAILFAIQFLHRRFLPQGIFHLAISSILRRKWMVGIQVSALSFGLMILLLLLVVQRDMLQVWQNSIPIDAPNRFLGNISVQEKESLWKDLATLDLAPDAYLMARGRMMAINGRPLKSDDFDRPSAKAFVQREFNVGFMDPPPVHNIIRQGEWFSEETQAEVSLEQSLLDDMGFNVGDIITWNFAGQTLETKIVGTRSVNWSSLEVNFYAILPAAFANNLPTTWVTALHVDPSQQGQWSALLKRYPNILVWNLDAIFKRLQSVLQQVGSAVQLLAYFTLFAGCIVLYTALSIHIKSRSYEFSLLRSLGATQKQLFQMSRLELLLIGGVAGVLAVLGTQMIAFGFMRQLFAMQFYLPLYFWILSILIAILAVFVSAWRPMRTIIHQSPMHLLRTHNG